MTELLSTYPGINVVNCENDNMALGAIEAIENAGRVAGSDIANGEIIVLSFDGEGATALEKARTGQSQMIGECNPLHGPRVKALLEMLKLGMKPEKFSYVDETLFTAIDTIPTVTAEGMTYGVTILEKPEGDDTVKDAEALENSATSNGAAISDASDEATAESDNAE